MTVQDLIDQLEGCDPDAKAVDAHGNPIEIVDEDDGQVMLTSNAS